MADFRDKIAKRLGVTPSGLEALAKAGIPRNAGRIGGGMAACKLIDQGYATDENQNGTYITDEGRKLLATARAMGW